MSSDPEATLKAAIREALLQPLESEAPASEQLAERVFRAVLADPVRWALLSLVVEGRIEFAQLESGVLEPQGYCEHCHRLVGVTDRQGVGLADRAAYMDSRAKGRGCYLVPHDQQGTSARCPGGGKRIHS